jgi:glycosyltransferase involved in cell wall biosynthesis
VKIGFYVPAWPPGSTANGIITYVSQLVPALRQLGHEVFLLTFNKTTDDRDPHTINLRNFLSDPSLATRVRLKLAPDATVFNAMAAAIAGALRELVAEHNLDILEMEESFGWSSALARLKLLPIVVRLHGPYFIGEKIDNPDERPSKRRSRDIREGAGIALADYVTCPSAAVLGAVKHHYSFGLPASSVIPNPIRAETKKWSPETCDENSLLFIGRFDGRKGGEFVVRAFAELAKLYPRLKLTFVGPDRGLHVDGGKVWSFESFVQNCVSQEDVSRINFRGQIAHCEIGALRVKHFATVVASRHENMPYSVLEAMALGCPLVATSVGGIPELITDESNGLLVHPGDAGSLANGCRRLLEDKDLAQRLGSQAWRDCCDLYRPADIAQRTIEAYRQAIDAFRDRI